MSTRCIATLVVVYTALQSVIYFGHQAVPNPDFMDYKAAADAVLSGEFPAGAKRTPVLGLVHRALAVVVPGSRAELTAGWLLNAVLHPVTALLFFSLARKRIGDVFAGFLSVALFTNPWTIRWLVQPLVEIPLGFLVIAFFWAQGRRSPAIWWIAAFASVLRYDGAALVGVACVVALVDASTRRERWVALGRGALALVPVAAWLVATAVYWPEDTGGRHYLEVVDADKLSSSLGSLFKVSWLVTATPYLSWSPTTDRAWGPAAQAAFMAGGAILVLLGASRAFRTRDRTMLATMLYAAVFACFLLTYWIIPRYCASLSWVLMLLAASGLHDLARFIPRRGLWPRLLRRLVFLCAAIWAFVLVRRLGFLGEQFPSSRWIPWFASASLAVMTLIGALDRSKAAAPGRRWLVVGAALFCAMLLSNQRALSTALSDGKARSEFGELGAWLEENAKPEDTVAVELPALVRYFVATEAPSIVNVRAIHGTTVREFFEICEAEGMDLICLHKCEPKGSSESGWKRRGFEREIAATEAQSEPYRRVRVFENARHGCEMVVFGRR